MINCYVSGRETMLVIETCKRKRPSIAQTSLNIKNFNRRFSVICTMETKWGVAQLEKLHEQSYGIQKKIFVSVAMDKHVYL